MKKSGKKGLLKGIKNRDLHLADLIGDKVPKKRKQHKRRKTCQPQK